ncbi:hypothetical protein L6R52_16920 [Myxococcota bacterium]|nr:hypothetical protein [Myxococcota bacterium]
MPRGLVGAIALSLVACAPSVDVLTMPGLRTGGLVVITLSDDAAPAAYALDVGAEVPDRISVPVPRGARASLFAVQYSCGLDALGLRAGPVAIVDAPAGRPLPPRPPVLRGATWQSGQDRLEWSVLDALPDALRTLRLEGTAPSPCIHFNPTVVPLADDADAEVMVELAEDAVLAATRDGRFYRVTRAGAERLTSLSTTTPHLGAFRAADGTLWLRGHDGRVVYGDLERGFVEHPARATPSNDLRVWLDGPRTTDDPFELFAVTREGSFEHFDGATWRVLDTLHGTRTDRWGGVAWLGPGEALAVGPRPNALVRATDGTVRVEELQPPDSIRELTSIAFVPSLGPAVGGDLGFLYLLDEGTWRGRLETPLSRPVQAIAPLDRGLLFGGEKNVFAQYHPDHGFCDNVEATAGTRVERVVMLGRTLVALGNSKGRSEVTFLDPLDPEPPACDAR